ncbi:MAG: peptide deformylase [Clostridia bacterium]|nr:peptide deformylase [Clostridia bacterium]
MAIRAILSADDPALRRVCRPVQAIDDNIRLLAGDMIETLKKADGVGLAAPQVGILRRLFVVDIGQGPVVFINPTLRKHAGNALGNEGCLSLPGLRRDVYRPNTVTVEALDLDGNLMEYSGQGLFARAICHELDHLEGILLIDRAGKQGK